MRTIDRCILGSIALGIWVLAGAILVGPRPAASQSATISGLMGIAAEQISRLDCRLDGTTSKGTMAGDIRCHL